MNQAPANSNVVELRLQRSLQALRREVGTAIQASEGRSGPGGTLGGDRADLKPDLSFGESFEDTVRRAMTRLGELFGIGR